MYQQGGYGAPQQGGYPPQQGGYPPQQGGYPPQQGGYPPQQGGYPPQQGGYPPQQGGYPPQQGGYPPQQGGYPPQQGGYPPQQGGYPPQQGGYQQQGGYPQQGGYNGLELIDAWYGTDAQHHDAGGNVDRLIRDMIQRTGRIQLDGNLNGLFGFDPVPGQVKVCFMRVRHNGQEHQLRAQEGQQFSFPNQQGGYQQQGGYPQQGGYNGLELLDAWYGTDAQHHDAGGNVDRLIRDMIQRNGRIHLDGNLNGLFGFDPVPGQVKVCYMRVRHNGQEHHLRAQEGQHFNFPY